MYLKDELLELKVGNENIALKKYQPTDEELLLIETKIIDQMRVAITAQDLRIDLNGEVWHWIMTECNNHSSITNFSARGHQWELSHGRFYSSVRWIHCDSRKVSCYACIETQVPMSVEEAYEWGLKTVEDDEFLNFFGVPTNPMQVR